MELPNITVDWKKAYSLCVALSDETPLAAMGRSTSRKGRSILAAHDDPAAVWQYNAAQAVEAATQAVDAAAAKKDAAGIAACALIPEWRGSTVEADRLNLLAKASGPTIAAYKAAAKVWRDKVQELNRIIFVRDTLAR